MRAQGRDGEEELVACGSQETKPEWREARGEQGCRRVEPQAGVLEKAESGTENTVRETG